MTKQSGLAKVAAILVATLGLGGGACDGGPDPGEEGRTEHRKRAPVEDTARFVGAWQAISGTVVLTCPGYATSTGSVGRRIKWSEGIGWDLVLTQEGAPCLVNANIVGSTASGSGPTCNISDGGVDAAFTISTYAFVIAADGQTAQEDYSATFATTIDGKGLTCPATMTATYQKVSK